MANIKKPEGTSKSKMLSVSLSADDVQVVKGLADLERVSVSEIVRRGIVLYNASIVTTSEDVLSKFIECKRFVRDNEDCVVDLLQNKYNNNMTVDGWKYYVSYTPKYEYTSATNDLIQFVENAKKKERIGGIAKKVKDSHSVYVRKATPSVVLAS